MKRAVSPKLRVVAVLTALFSFISFQPASAAQFATTMNSTCSVTAATTGWSIAYPFNVPETATVTRIDWKVDGAAPSDAYIKIRRDFSGAPSGAFLGTFTYSSYSNPIASFTGTAVLEGAGRYWLIFRQASTISVCYSTSPVYTGSPSGWTMGTTFTYTSSNAGLNYASRNDYMAFLITMFGTGGGVPAPTSSISLSGSSTANYRQAMTISASLGVAGTDGKVTFYANGKKIPGCINRLSSALSASCDWSPSNRGSVAITARVIPTDPEYGASTSAAKNILVGNRSTNR